MDTTNKVKVTNMCGHDVTVNRPELGFRRDWKPKMSHMIEKDLIEELLLGTGFRYIIDNGMLYIEDLETKKELGLEPEDATEPVNIVILSDKDKEEYLTKISLAAFKEKVNTLPIEQLRSLVDYAIAHRLVDINKAKVLKTKTGRDIVKAIELEEADQAK